MKKTKLFLTVAAVAFAAMTSSRALADDSGGQVTLTGNLVCGKCVLHQTKECQNVLLVADNGKTNEYFLAQNALSKDFHSNICTTDGEKATVTGTVKKKGSKEVLTPTKIEPQK